MGCRIWGFMIWGLGIWLSGEGGTDGAHLGSSHASLPAVSFNLYEHLEFVIDWYTLGRDIRAPGCAGVKAHRLLNQSTLGLKAF